jgi:hypothetical protein
VDGREGYVDDFVSKDQHAFKREFFKIPKVNDAVLTSRGQRAVPSRCFSAGQLKMRLPHVSDDLELTLRVPLVDHDPAVKRAYQQQTVFFEEDDPDDRLILILVVLARRDVLQKVPRLAAVLPHKPPGVPYKELPTLVAELACTDIGVIAVLV